MRNCSFDGFNLGEKHFEDEPLLTRILKYIGFGAPVLYAIAVFGFFKFLDKNASSQAKRTISDWLLKEIRIIKITHPMRYSNFSTEYTANLFYIPAPSFVQL